MKALFCILFSLSVTLKISAQDNNTISKLIFYNENSRDGMISTLFIDNKEIATLDPKSKLVFNFKKEGKYDIKVKTIYIFKGIEYPVGKPETKSYSFEKGKEYHLTTKSKNMGGITLELANEKQIEKLKKNKFIETKTYDQL